MNRREFGSATASVLLLKAIRSSASATGDKQGSVSQAAHALHQRAIVLDSNAAVEIDKLPLSPDDLRICRESGLTSIKTTVGGYGESLEDTLKELALQLQMIETYPDTFMQVRRVEDIAAAKRNRKLGIILSFEGVDMLEGKLERIGLFRNLGVRVMQLSYNKTSPFGSGVLADPPSGLTDLGRSAVATMNELGVAVDLSHASPSTTSDAIAASSRPVLMTPPVPDGRSSVITWIT